MTKQRILENIKRNKPERTGLPEMPVFAEQENPVDQFKEVSSVSSRVIELNEGGQLSDFIVKEFPGCNIVVDMTKDYGPPAVKPEDVDVLVLEGTFGVAENGAVWVTEKNMSHRLLPFATQHLILKLEKKKIVSDMHQAYKMIHLGPDFGVFIAGPSKTADIEQALVVGAHGPRSLTIALYESY